MNRKDNFQSLKGYFLISEATMLDPNFKHTVVLMIEHNEDGAFGLIVNKKSSLSETLLTHPLTVEGAT